VLVYATCTISQRENEQQVAALEADQGIEGLAVADLGAQSPGLASGHDRRCLQVRPDRDRTSGFFFARLEKAA
jgi:16S rRNA C967 or C1407 C5-methylase (RsmB/RsmF family)